MDDSSLKRKTVSGLFWKMAERVGSQLIRMVVMVVLARLLTPEDYGAIALVMVFISVCDVILVNGLTSPLIQKKEADTIDFSTIFYCSITLGALLFLIVYLCAPAIAHFYDMEILCPVLRVLAIGIIISAAGSVQNAYVSRMMKFRTFFFSTLIGLIISGGIGIWMAYQGYGVWALVGQTLSMQVVDLIVVFVFIHWLPTLEFSLERLKEMWSFGWKIFVAAFINNLFQDIRTILIGKYYTKQDLAYYNQGNQYPQLIMQTVNSSINSVLFPAIAKIQDDIPNVRAFLRRSIQLGSFILCPVLFGFAAIAEPLILLLLTEKWLPSVPFIQVICIAMFLSPISTPSQQAIKAIGRSDVTMKQEVIKKSVYLLLIIGGLFISVWGVVIASAIGEIWCVFVNAFPCKKYLNYSFKDQLFDILPNLVSSVIMALLVYSVNILSLSPLFTLTIQLPLAVIVYISLCVFLKNESYYYCIENINASLFKHKTRQ